MRQKVLLPIFLLLPFLAACFGSERRQRIYIRREFAAVSEVVSSEMHNDTGRYHSLNCKGPRARICTWKKAPKLSTKEYSLTQIDALVLDQIQHGTPMGALILGKLGVYYRQLPAGFEYTILEGKNLPQRLDDLPPGPRK